MYILLSKTCMSGGVDIASIKGGYWETYLVFGDVNYESLSFDYLHSNSGSVETGSNSRTNKGRKFHSWMTEGENVVLSVGVSYEACILSEFLKV